MVHSRPSHAARNPKSVGGEFTTLEDLKARFDQFRNQHPGQRVPIDLREATLAALESGVRAYTLQKTCGVSWSQLESWKKSGRTEPSVRVLTVVDEPSKARGAGFELRVGSWSVSVRFERG